MPLPRIIARANRFVLNPVTRRFAGRIAPFAIIGHRGRKSGRQYHLPIMAFPQGDGFIIALTYGPDTDWVKNVMTAGECTLTYRNRQIHLTDPQLFEDDPRHLPFPAIVKTILHFNRIDHFLSLRLPS
jgi:deazaflavin-dependent oxidoreductase (nitroreductase family)